MFAPVSDSVEMSKCVTSAKFHVTTNGSQDDTLLVSDVGVVTPLVGGVAQAFHGDQVVELRVQLAVQEVEGKEEDRKGQVETDEEKRLKEVRSWMTMEMFMTRLRS